MNCQPRCQAITASGEQCTREPDCKKGCLFTCWQHAGRRSKKRCIDPEFYRQKQIPTPKPPTPKAPTPQKPKSKSKSKTPKKRSPTPQLDMTHIIEQLKSNVQYLSQQLRECEERAAKISPTFKQSCKSQILKLRQQLENQKKEVQEARKMQNESTDVYLNLVANNAMLEEKHLKSNKEFAEKQKVLQDQLEEMKSYQEEMEKRVDNLKSELNMAQDKNQQRQTKLKSCKMNEKVCKDELFDCNNLYLNMRAQKGRVQTKYEDLVKDLAAFGNDLLEKGHEQEALELAQILRT